MMLPYSEGVDKDAARKAYQVALQKAVTQKLMTPGSRFEGLKGQSGGKFDGTSTVLNDKPAVLVKDVKFQDGANSFGKEGYVPNTIQLGGTTLYGLQQGNNVVFSPKTRTPLMESFKTKIEAPEPEEDVPTPSTGPSLDPNATEQYASNFKSGQANMSNIQDMYSDRKDLQEWAKANPALAQKEFAKAEAKAIKSGKASSAYDAEESFNGSDIPEADRQNPADQAAALGIKNLSNDAQVFKDTAMTTLLNQSQNEGVTPILEEMNIPTTTNYAGAFNQADMPDLASMMSMGEQLGDLGIKGPNFAQGQKFKDLFQNTILGK